MTAIVVGVDPDPVLDAQPLGRSSNLLTCLHAPRPATETGPCKVERATAEVVAHPVTVAVGVDPLGLHVALAIEAGTVRLAPGHGDVAAQQAALFRGHRPRLILVVLAHLSEQQQPCQCRSYIAEASGLRKGNDQQA